jgi:DNA-binding response OmpR family regulator
VSAPGPLVLVADDDRDIVRLLTTALGRAGYEVVTAADGAEALALAEERRPSLLVLDVAMPELDGLEVLRRVRADPANENLPVILLSARAQESDVARGYETGASKYVSKPFSPRELVAVVDELVG